ncbi:MAG: hypothetical protein Q9180_005630 [Flavoplaca navasiana]
MISWSDRVGQLTAEAIAEKTSRPLLIVSVAQIGLNASKAERNLERMFELASRWEAILLVYWKSEPWMKLMSFWKRGIPKPIRTEMPSSLILTTNRINSLDAAVQSRIHLAVRFDELTREQTQSILKTILRKFDVKDLDVEEIMKSFISFLEDSPEFKLNGRQIRNIVFSAHAMALSEGKESIGWDHIRDVLRVTKDFQAQLKDVINKQRLGREAAKQGG